MTGHQYSLAALAELLKVKCVGDPEILISGLATLASAGPGQLSFLANPKYQKALAATQAEAVIVAADMVGIGPANALVSDNPYLTYAKASQLFADTSMVNTGIHPSAVVSDTAQIDPSACIGPNVAIADNVVIGPATVIHAGCSIGHDTVLGESCLLYANVSLYHGVTVGDRAIIHSGTVIGSDGFGFAPSPDREKGGWVKIAQLGGVVIGDDVEIGAGCTIDRGALDDTRIGDRVILDNQVQIAHNVELGDNTGMAGCSAIAGSTKVGKNCTIAGGAGIVGHVEIADNVHITAFTLVSKSITQAGAYSSGTPMQDSRSWRRSAVRFSQLDEMSKRLTDVEKKLD